MRLGGVIGTIGLALAIGGGIVIVSLVSGGSEALNDGAKLAGLVLLLSIAGCWIAGRVGREAQERRFLRRLFVGAYAMRLFVAVAFLYLMPALVKDHPYLSHGFFGDDGMTYDRLAWKLLGVWQGGKFVDVADVGVPGARGYILLNTVLYAIFGHQTLAVRFFDSFLGALVPIFAYGVASRLLAPRWGRAAAVLIAFYPEQLLYSGVQLKDISVAFAMTAFLWLLFRWQEKRSVLGLAGMALCLVYVLVTRFFYAFPLLAGVAVTLWFRAGRERLRVRRLIPAVVLLGTLLIVTEFMLGRFVGMTLLDPLFSGRHEYYAVGEAAASRDSFYQVFTGVSGIPGRLAFVPVSAVYSLLNPFLLWPLLYSDPVYTLLSPAVVMWYVLMPFFLFSIVSRSNSPGWRPLVAVLAAAFFLLAVSGTGAVATGRHKIALQPIFMIYGVDGLRRFVAGSRRIREGLWVYGCALVATVLFYLYVKERVIVLSVISGAVVVMVIASVVFLPGWLRRWRASYRSGGGPLRA